MENMKKLNGNKIEIKWVGKGKYQFFINGLSYFSRKNVKKLLGVNDQQLRTLIRS